MKKTVNFLFPGNKLHEGNTKKIHKGSFAMNSPPFAVVLFTAPHPSTSGTASLGRLFLSRRLFLPQTSAMSPVTSTGLGVLKNESMEAWCSAKYAQHPP